MKTNLLYGSLQDLLTLKTFRSQTDNILSKGPSQSEFWALRNASFQIEQGDVVGLLGRNGAGKSTLLKLISRITSPTEGRISVRGRVGSLLEVGVGFHPELSGRENIFLSGVMLGIKHQEIKKRFDQIVEFSGIEKFLDLPIKRYSSGMVVRLGFAVAANLDQEILLLDEVLAVGDAEFQKKCLGRLAEIASDGRTIILVSHNLHNVLQSCSKALYLDAGKLIAAGETAEVARRYTDDLHNCGPDSIDRLRSRRQNWDGSFYGELARFDSFEVLNEDYCVSESNPLKLKLKLSGNSQVKNPYLLLSIMSPAGILLGSCMSPLKDFWKGDEAISLDGLAAKLPLMPGSYSLKLGLYEGVPTARNNPLDLLLMTPCFEVVSTEQALLRSDDAGCMLLQMTFSNS
ncbi:MAG: ATP-binding cassette domain-containing protein [Candidatus Obscuribacterales bacterium]|nr:ATP-binding cassette domain-containing protein [Candidatus Obscuribacterales bacterium]